MSATNTYAIYLAGPEVFLDELERRRVTREKQAILHRHGLTGLDPMDNELALGDDLSPPEKGYGIYQANIRLLQRCHGALVNLTPFRGVSADPGTVFETGYLAALAKPMVGYTLEARDYCQRVAQPHAAGLDEHGLAIEQFGLMDNLMIESAIAAAGGRVIRGTRGQGGGVALFDSDQFAEATAELRRLLDH